MTRFVVSMELKLGFFDLIWIQPYYNKISSISYWFITIKKLNFTPADEEAGIYYRKKKQNKKKTQRNKTNSSNKQPVSYLCDVRQSSLIPRVLSVDPRIHDETSTLVVATTTCIIYRLPLSHLIPFVLTYTTSRVIVHSCKLNLRQTNLVL